MILLDNLESVLIQSVTVSPTNTINMFTDLSNDLLGINFDKISSTNSATLTLLSDEKLQPFIIDQIKLMISNLKNEGVKDLENQREVLTTNLDKLNFLVKNARDGYYDNPDTKKVELSGYTSSNFYKKYSFR